MSGALEILQPGAFTTVQDQGRYGYQQYGVPPCGVLDGYAAQLANLLVGNPAEAALLEITFAGPSIRILSPCVLALTGAEMELLHNGQHLGGWRSFAVQPGDLITMGIASRGCRAYLALGGGIDVPLVMGSRSCYTGAGFGGHEGRPLRQGDVLPQGILDRGNDPPWVERAIPDPYIPEYQTNWTIRAIAGPQEDYFSQSLVTFFNSEFTVSPQVNRMGYRLEGTKIRLDPGMPASIISEPSLPGGIQIPEGGDPIILLSEQTVGGYAKIATVISSDIGKLAQAMPGDRIRFQQVSVEQAHTIYRRHASMLARLKELDLSVQSFASMGRAYFNSEIFRSKVNHYLFQL
ncbi:5-oxoprolinase subunit C family protein [Desulfogranum mediterraneum]|uniref:5-oxoprolinase subunit C family protein n=1 Tax=Desulfogranum mediterraneum TaxID=160661 RepID=UPI0004171203|nr:biotin-dependent carboxyltransferase family protein [Desulfogranum mediterraneum]